MMRRCDDRDFELIWAIINDGAKAYKGIIPADRWTEPYMSHEELHAYVRTSSQKRGIGAQLLSHLRGFTSTPVLIGTWADAVWAIQFYEKYGFQLVGAEEKDRLLRKYWTIPERQIETSVVLADSKWWETQR